jgi:thioredoxin-like negative regulator of GroEL
VVGLTSVAAQAFAQQESPPAGPHQEANETFFGPVMWALVVIPCVLMMALAIRRAKTRPGTLPQFDDQNFEAEVIGSALPVLVHFARAWNVADAAARSQTELLRWQNRGSVQVGVLDIDDCPAVMERFPGLEPPAYLLFYKGRKLFHRPGLRQANEVQDDIDRALSHEGF